VSPTRCRARTPIVLLGAVFATLAGPATAAEPVPRGGGTPREILVVDPEGEVRSWVPGHDLLRAAIIGDVGSVNDLSFAGGGRWVLLPARTSTAPARESRRGGNDGEAVVVSLPSSAPGVPPLRLHFPGEGLRTAASTAGAAYVLAHEGGGKPAEGKQGQTWIHRLDLEAGQVTASTAIDRPGSALAIDPDGRRLYLAEEGRIRSFTTSPLAASWHYRSPGVNRALAVRPETHIVYVARAREIAVFDPNAVRAPGEGDPPDRPDDASAVIGLSSEPAGLRFSDDGRLLLVIGQDREVEVIDVERRAPIPIATPSVVRTAANVRPIAVLPGGPAVIACFPAGIVISIELPSIESTPAAAAIATQAAILAPDPLPGATVAPSAAAVASIPPIPETTPVPEYSPVPEPSPVPAPSPVPMPSPIPPAPIVVPPGGVLVSGSVLGAIQRVAAIVIYGPGSIVREAARVTPHRDGRWEVSLARPGIYRVVPVGPGSAPVGASPGFHTVKFESTDSPGAVVSGIDFTIPAGR